MFVIIGVVVVIGSVLGGYAPHGDIGVLIQPLEVLIICGAAFGAFLISNQKSVIFGVLKAPAACSRARHTTRLRTSNC